MMNSLFTSFDPLTSMMSMNHLILFFTLTFSSFMMLKNLPMRLNQMLTKLFLSLELEMKQAINNKNTKGKTNMLLSLFFLMLLMNLTGLIPYVFTTTSHLLYSLSMALPFWLGFMLFNITKNPQHFLSHLVPNGTPLMLSQFMVVIELISQMIRPITLSVRLAANMTAGHILMALCSNNILIMSTMSLALIMLLVLEIAVAFIQSYVFSTLVTMYLSEVYD